MIITAKKLAALTVGAVLGTAGFAFMNSNTVAASGAGSGSGPVYGYNITNVDYAPSADGDDSDMDDSSCFNSGQICAVTFDVSTTQNLEPLADTVYANFNGSEGNLLGNWVHCDKTGNPNMATTSWYCDFETPQPLKPIYSLDVRATS